MSRGKAVFLGIVIVILGLALLTGVAIVVNAWFSKSSAEFDLESQPVYKEAMFDIREYYFKPFDVNKITTAAEAAVKKEQKKGVTSEARLTNAGVNALLRGLGDPHSEYLSPNENKRLEQDLSGTFFGVGFTLRLEKQRPQVVTIIKDSPSDKAGVKPDDVIMSVDGKDTLGEGLDSVVLRIRGRQGTRVKIKVKRGTKNIDFTMTREKIQIPDFEYELQDGKYGVLKLYEFNKDIGQKVRNAVKELQEQGAQGFILDVRNDPGGLLDEAVNTASVFVPSGTIVSYQTKGQPKMDEAAKGGAETDKPLVVLVNKGSASSSEIVAGALKDHKRGVLVGTKTYGKGSVQKVFDLGNGGAAKLTISLYYLPNGESIDGKGIEPDVKVEVEDDAEAEDRQQMDAAKQVLQNLIEGKPAARAPGVLRPAA